MHQQKKNNAKGFTLIEVLVAVAILSIALTAIIHSTAQNIRNTAYLQEKNIATWVGTEVMNEARAGVIKLNDTAAEEQEKKALGQPWRVKAYATLTPNSHIQQLHVDVYRQSNDIKIVSLVSYRYVT